MKRVKEASFFLPSILGVIIFVLVPFGDMVRRSFCTAVTGEFAGVTNYDTIFHNEAFLLAVKNTCRFVAICLPLLIISSLLIALILSNCKWIKTIKSMLLFPLAVPTATVVLIWKMLFYKNGMINEGLEVFGIQGADWMNSQAAFWVLVLSFLWKNIGYTVILWLAGIAAIPESILESAKVDGANSWKRFYYVVMPNLKPVLYTITVLSFLNSFKIFREAYLVAGSYPQESMYLLQHLFNNWFTKLELDKMAAAAVCIAVVLGIFEYILQSLWDTREG